MRWADGLQGITHLASAAADTPFLPSNLVQKLEHATGADNDIAMAHSLDRIHPVFGVWPIALADELEHFLVAED